jgi:DMSO/TMAO reductase YedYZ heme-binding membrane subunit
MKIDSDQIILLLRITGILAFGLLVIQIILGAFKKKMFHHFLSIAIFILIVLHPLLYVLFLLKIKGVFNPFYVFSDLCLLCQGKLEFYLNFGRVAFWLMAFSLFVILFKNSSQFLKKYANKLHRLNYVAFYLLAVHALFLGNKSLNRFYLAGVIIVTLIGVWKLKLKRSN